MKLPECQFKNWEDVSLTLGIKEVMKFGFGRSTVDAWFHRADFPKIPNTNLIEKHSLMCWLQNRKIENLQIDNEMLRDILENAIKSKVNSLFIKEVVK
ncbi:MAG: hypothetical protein RR290_00580 [Clostridia bacterium]